MQQNSKFEIWPLHLFISGEQRPNFEGTGEQRQYWGTENIRKQIFDFWGTGEQANLFQGNKGTGTPPGRASTLLSLSLARTNSVVMLTGHLYMTIGECSEWLSGRVLDSTKGLQVRASPASLLWSLSKTHLS